MAGIGSHTYPNCGLSDDWCTPNHVLDALGLFDDDPCPIGGVDGLKRLWIGRVFLNPPYGKSTGIWLNKLANHGNGIALIFARTETKMFFEHVWSRADALLFLRGRLYFLRPDGSQEGNAGGPSVLIAYGKQNVECLQMCGLAGQFIERCSMKLYPIVEYAHKIGKNTAEFTASDMSRYTAWWIKQPVREDLMSKKSGSYNKAMESRIPVDVEQIDDGEVQELAEQVVSDEIVADMGLTQVEVDALSWGITELLGTYDFSEMLEVGEALTKLGQELEPLMTKEE